HNCIIPFTRMLAGPLDYEPGLLDNATSKQFKPVWGKVMSQTTRCQQLAMFVVYDDPLPIFSGNPSQGYLEPKFMDLLGSIPAGWDTKKEVVFKRQPLEFTTLKNPQRFVFFRPGAKGTLTH
ncbi:MAG TPA: glycoside hydrolase family 97 catalytic domain-containing protein, partial [Parafilimonas sp.]